MDVTKLKAWWNTVELPRRMMLIAPVLLFFSQHLEYQASYDYTRQFGGWDIPGTSPSVTGWQMHPGAFVVMAALAAAFLTPF